MLIEALTATFVAMFIILGAWSVYIMGWSWWHEVAPRIEAQRTARLALLNIIVGRFDPTAGTFSVGADSFSRRNGISCATAAPDISTPHRINFRLEPDSSNVRSYYMGVDAATGSNAVYYVDNNSVVHEIRGTLGITDLTFEQVSGAANLIKVSALSEKTVAGTRSAPYTVRAAYNETIYLRNVQ